MNDQALLEENGNGKEVSDIRVLKSGEKDVDIQVLNSLRAGESAFTSWGMSEVKTMKDGKVTILRIPIKSVGLADVMEKILAEQPTPPRRFVKKTSLEGRELGLTTDQFIEDPLDEFYIKSLRAYEVRGLYKLVLHAFAIDVFDSDGTTYLVKANSTNTATHVVNEDKAILVLKQQGLTGDQLKKISNDVKALTQFEEERVDRE